MKKLLFLFCMLLMGVSGAWADYVTELTDRGRYTISFVSFDGNKTWGLSTSTTTASLSADAVGSVFVAHKYTNEQGQERWIFVNNEDGYYLAYKAATQNFNISKPVNEFSVGQLSTTLTNVDNAADCSNKLYITADCRSASEDKLGCYTVKESTGAFDNSAAPFYKLSNKNYFTSALYFTASEAAVSDAASLAIAKFDALYAIKSYINTAEKMSALFDATNASMLESAINSASALEGSYSPGYIAQTFLQAAEGKKFYAVSNEATGQYLNVDATRVTATATSLTADAVMEAEYAGAGKYYLKGVNSGYYICAPVDGSTAPTTESSKANASTFYIGNFANTTDNVVYFSTTRKGEDQIEAIHYSKVANPTYYTCGWDYDGDASQWKITYISDDDYTTLSSATEETLNYTLTDANGATYSGTFTGTLGVNPSFTGCDGHTISNTAWNISTKTFTADIVFPFPITSNSKTNLTYIGSYIETYTSNKFYWYADGTSVKSTKNKYPTNVDHANFEWSICPSITNGAITFTLKNASNSKSIYSTATGNEHDATTITLETTGKPFTYVAGTQGTQSGYQWKMSDNLCLSRNNSSTETLPLGVNSTHYGTLITIIDNPADFIQLDANLSAARTAFEPYSTLIGNGLGQYSGATATQMATAYATAVSPLTAEELTTLTTALINPATKLTLNLPSTGGFYWIKGETSKKYLCNKNEYISNGSYNVFKNTSEPSDAIFYLEANNNKNYLLSYGTGLYNNTNKSKWNWGLGLSNAEKVVFSEGNIGYYQILTGEGDNARYFYDADTYIDRGSSASGDRYNKWTIEEVTSLPVTVSAANYATFCSPVAVDIPELDDVTIKAYYASDLSGGRLKMTSIDGTIPANTPAIIYASPAGTYNFPIHSGSVDAIADKYALFCGTTAAVTAASVLTGDYASGYAVLTLQKGAGDTAGDRELGFYKYSGDNLGGFKTYMLFDTSGSDVKGFRLSFDDDNATGLEAMDLEAMDNGQWIIDNGSVYNLAGQKVNGKLSKGLYIVNGKKVLVK